MSTKVTVTLVSNSVHWIFRVETFLTSSRIVCFSVPTCTHNVTLEIAVPPKKYFHSTNLMTFLYS